MQLQCRMGKSTCSRVCAKAQGSSPVGRARPSSQTLYPYRPLQDWL